jgi:hypothetical protein
MQWNMTYGGTGNEAGYSMVQTADGEYAIAGETDSYGAGGTDFYLVKTSSSGAMLWNKIYGGTGNDYARSVVQTNDEGYAIAGYTNSTGASGSGDIWLVTTDANGNMQWSLTYNGTWFIGSKSYPMELACSVVQTADGNYALAGHGGFDREDFILAKTGVGLGLAWTDSTADTITLYRGDADPYWNYVRVRIWKPKTP